MWSFASIEFEVREGKMWVVIALSSAGAMLQPRDSIVGAPRAEDEGHVAGEGAGHSTEVAVVYGRDILVATLGECECVGGRFKFNLHVEWAV